MWVCRRRDKLYSGEHSGGAYSGRIDNMEFSFLSLGGKVPYALRVSFFWRGGGFFVAGEGSKLRSMGGRAGVS